MKLRNSAIFLYSTALAFILGWWLLAFQKNLPIVNTQINSPSLQLDTPEILSYLSPISRNDLLQALGGDSNLMMSFITCWEGDAKILESKGFKGIKRLQSDRILQAILLNRVLTESSSEKKNDLNRKFRAHQLQDDTGHIIPVNDSYCRFFPQTYATASILLAIASPEEILFIPKGLRDLSHIYFDHKLEKISRELEGYNNEKLFLAYPHLTFVSPYSHPSTIEALKKQGLELCIINKINSLDDIQETILKIGHATNHPLEANLLQIFMEASLIAIDNRIKALKYTDSKKMENKFFYITERQGYMVPTSKCLVGQLLHRIQQQNSSLSCYIPNTNQEWFIPIDREQIIQSDPDYLIISTSQNQLVSNQPQTHPHFSKPVYYLDENIQNFPTQYMALAYFDLYQALEKNYSK